MIFCLAMHYVLMSSNGNMIDSYEDEAVARVALGRIVDAEPEAVDDVALMAYGEDGWPVGEPLLGRAVAAELAPSWGVPSSSGWRAP